MKGEKKKFGVHELSKDQMTQLKQYYWNEKRIREKIKSTWGDFDRVDELVTDEEIFKAYGHIKFDEDDFIHW